MEYLGQDYIKIYTYKDWPPLFHIMIQQYKYPFLALDSLKIVTNNNQKNSEKLWAFPYFPNAHEFLLFPHMFLVNPQRGEKGYQFTA